MKTSASQVRSDLRLAWPPQHLLLRAGHGDEREVARAQLQPDLLFFVLVGRFDEDVLEGALLSRRPPLGAVATAARAGGLPRTGRCVAAAYQIYIRSGTS